MPHTSQPQKPLRSRLNPTLLPLVLLVIGCALVASAASAQGHGPGGPPGGGPGGPGGHGPLGGGSPLGRPPLSSPSGSSSSGPDGSGPGSSSSGNMGDASTRSRQLGPMGRWWDDAQYARTIGLNSTQQKRMDNVFGASRDQLQKLYSNLKTEETQLGKVSRSSSVNEEQLDQQIDRVAQARSELQKATTHMLLQIRKEMTPDQISRLDATRTAQ